MKRIIFIFMVLSMTLLGGVTEEYDEELKSIENQYDSRVERNSSTAGMIDAAKEEYEELDKLLNKYYQMLMATLDEEQKSDLKKSQMEWIKFRDAELSFSRSLYSKKEGTMWKLFPYSTAIELVKERVQELVGYIADAYD